MTAHPPPSSRHALPPLQLTQKGNVNVVTPFTKKKLPEDVKKVLNSASLVPTAVPPSNIKGKKELPPVPDDVRQIHASQTKPSGQTSLESTDRSQTKALAQTDEISAPVSNIEAPATPRQNQTSFPSTESARPNTNVEIPETSVILPSSGAIPKTSKHVTKPTTRENSKLQQKKTDKSPGDLKRKMPIPKSQPEKRVIGKPNYANKTKSVKESRKSMVEGSSEQHNETKDKHIILKSEETIINMEEDKDAHGVTPSIQIPTIDVELSTPRGKNQLNETDKQTGVIETETKGTSISDKCKGEKSDIGEPFLIKTEKSKSSEDQKALPDANSKLDKEEQENKNDQKHNDLTADKLDLQSISTSQSPSKEVHYLQPPSLHFQNQFEPVRLQASPDDSSSSNQTVSTSKHQSHSYTANISSNASQTMPSVESVLPSDTSPSVSEKAVDSDTHGDTLQDGDFSDSLMSEEEIPSPPPKQQKQFFFEPEGTPAILTLALPRNSNTDAFISTETNEETQASKNAVKQGRAGGPARSAASSRLLKSSYGTKPMEALTVYNPSVAKREIDPKIKDMEHNKKEKERREMERSRKIRMGAMSAAYGTKPQAKGTKKK